MSKLDKKYIGKVKITRWSDYNQKSNTMALPTFPGRQNLESLHITAVEEKAI